MKLKKAFLIIAFAMVSIIALLYGLDPAWFARTFLGVDDLSVNFAQHPKGCHVPLSRSWMFLVALHSATNTEYTAILTTIIFAGGLVIGRLLSFIVDGQPAPLLIFYAALEFTIIPLAWWIL